MCMGIYIGEKYVSNVKEAAEFFRIPVGEIPLSYGEAKEGDEYCLCPVDVPGLAALCGYRFEADPFDWYFKKKV